MDLDPVTERHILIEHGVGMDDAIAPEHAPLADDRARMQRRPVADRGAVAHIGEGVDRDIHANLGRRCHTGLGMNAGPSRLLLADQVSAHGQKSRHGVINFDDGQALFHLVSTASEVWADDCGRCGRAAQ